MGNTFLAGSDRTRGAPGRIYWCAYCISCANGTDALQIALMALDVGPGDEIITPGFSYVATAEAPAVLGARAVYVDIDHTTYNLDTAQLEAAITLKLRQSSLFHCTGRRLIMTP